MWLRLDLRRRWRSVAVLTVLVALAAATVMSAVAGARRAVSAQERLAEHTLPATTAVLANTPGFDWTEVRKLPEVEALTTFVVDYTLSVQGIKDVSLGFPMADDEGMRTIERPVVLDGRGFDPARADEVVVTTRFVHDYHRGVGDTVTIQLPTPVELTSVEPGPNGLDLHGPQIQAKIVGVVRSPWFTDQPGAKGGLQTSPGLTARYGPNIVGDQKDPKNISFINALVRLRGGESALPAFRRDFERLTGRDDIDIWNLPGQQRDLQRTIVFEARCLLAFGVAALIASMFLIGQAVARYAAGSAGELATLRAVGMTPAQAVAAAATGPAMAGLFGGLLGAAGAVLSSRWLPIGTAAYFEPEPGIRPDRLVLLAGWVLVVMLVLAGAAAAAWLGLHAGRGAATRRSAVALLAARAGAGVPVLVGTRFALEPGRGRTAVPVRPALIGAVTGVIGVVAAFTFAHGVTDATQHPERFGQTFQLGGFWGLNGEDFGPVTAVRDAIQESPDVVGIDDGRIAVATESGGATSVSLWEFSGGPKPIPVVMTEGRMARSPNEVVLGPRTLAALNKQVGDTVQLRGTRSRTPVMLTITGAGMVPEGPHNGYADGGWLTTDGFTAMFTGYKYRLGLISLRDGVTAQAAIASLNTSVAAAVPQLQGQDLGLQPPPPLMQMLVLRNVQVLPIALGAFLALLAIAAVGHALATAVRRRSLDIAVLRALGMTRWQSGGVVVVQATLLAVIGLLAGIPLGFALGRSLWQVVASYTPLAYIAPIPFWALVLAVPGSLLLANILAAWPGRRAAVLRVAHVLRAE